MKNLYISIFIITIILFSISFTHRINAIENSIVNTTLGNNNYKNLEIPQSEIAILISKSTYVTGETIQINGSFNPNTMIHIDLVNPLGKTKNSSQTYSDNTGHFYTNLMIPLQNGVNGTWKILATSGLGHKSLDVMIISKLTTQNPPLVQFKTISDIERITCNTNLVKIIKATNNSPACVKPETSKILIERGWAKALQ